MVIGQSEVAGRTNGRNARGNRGLKKKKGGAWIDFEWYGYVMVGVVAGVTEKKLLLAVFASV